MNEERRAELRRIAEAATPGPRRSGWDDPPSATRLEAYDADVVYSTDPTLDKLDQAIVSGTWYDGPLTGCTRENAAHIAAFDRETCLALLDAADRVAALEAENAILRAEVESLRTQVNTWSVRAEAHRIATESAEQRIATLEAELATLKGAKA